MINSDALSRYSLSNRGSVPNRNNAGKFSHDYAVSEDGVEMTFATNYLGRRNPSLQLTLINRHVYFFLES